MYINGETRVYMPGVMWTLPFCSAGDLCACPAGFSLCAGQCLVRLTELLNYTDAEAACASWGAHLAVPRSAEENQCLQDMAAGADTWIGISDRAQEGVYAAADGGEPFASDSPFWAPGEPRDTTETNCVHLWSDADAWDDYFCERVQPALCQL